MISFNTNAGNPALKQELKDVIYQNNVKKIFKKVDTQFKRAVEDINKIAIERGWDGVCCKKHPDNKKDGQKLCFDMMPSYTVTFGTGNGAVIDRRDTEPQPCFFYLFKTSLNIDKAVGTEENLGNMAISGDISEFNEVYDYWKKTLNEEMEFFYKNKEAFLQTRDKIDKLFNEVICTASNYAKEQGWEGSIINPENSPFLEKNEETKFELLKQYRVWMNEESAIKQPKEGYIVYGITIIKTMAEFKELVKSNEEFDYGNLERYLLSDFKSMIDTKKVSQKSSNGCNIL